MKLLPLLEKPASQSSEKLSALQRVSYSTPISISLIGLLFPGMDLAHIAANRGLVAVRCLLILNALQAYRAVHGGEANSPSDLDLPESAIIDPFTGKPLIFKLTDEGLVIYTVMKNSADDAGDFHKQFDWGIASIGYPGAE